VIGAHEEAHLVDLANPLLEGALIPSAAPVIVV